MTDTGCEEERFCCRARMNRRTVVSGGVAAVTLAGAPGRIFAQSEDPVTMAPQPGDFLVFTTDKKTPLAIDSLESGARPRRAWPVDPSTMTPRSGTLYNLLMVSRWDPESLTEEARANATEGVVALTAICTHAACDVAGWLEDLEVMECPCHFSRYDPRDNGAVVQGPATRHLPALKLAVEDGKIVVASAFDSRVGGDVDA